MKASLRRQQHVRQQHIDALRGMTFASDDGHLWVDTVNLFTPDAGGIALSLQTRDGTVNLLLPPSLAAQVGAGLSKLSRSADL
jgi:hypothetical protein